MIKLVIERALLQGQLSKTNNCVFYFKIATLAISMNLVFVVEKMDSDFRSFKKDLKTNRKKL